MDWKSALYSATSFARAGSRSVPTFPQTSVNFFANSGSLSSLMLRAWFSFMAFNEDQNRVRKHHGDQNLAVLRRIAVGLLRRDKSVNLGAKNKRLKAGRNRNYLLHVLLSPAEVK